MTREKWTVVEKSDGYFVFKDDPGLQIALNYAAKNAVFHASIDSRERADSNVLCPLYENLDGWFQLINEG